jgi:LEA14-like dessication related protein
MKRKVKYAGLFLLMMLVIVAGCAFVFRARIITHCRPEIRQIGVIHINIKNDTSYINSKLEIKNEVFFKIRVDTIKYKIDLFDKTYIQSTEALGIQLPQNGRDTIDFLIKIPHASLLKSIRAERKKGDSAGYEINVALQVSTLFWNGEIPFNRSAKLKIPKPPELELIEIKYKKIRLRTIIADAKIKITNHSNVTLAVKGMNYKMKLHKQGDLKGNYQRTIHLKPKGATFVNLPMEINIDHVGKILWAVLTDKDNYDYVLSMNATIESTSPLTETFRVELIKSGKMELKK